MKLCSFLVLVSLWVVIVEVTSYTQKEYTLRKVFCAYFKPTSYEFRKYNLGRLCTAKVKQFENAICVTDPTDKDSPIEETCRDMSFLDTRVRVVQTVATVATSTVTR